MNPPQKQFSPNRAVSKKNLLSFNAMCFAAVRKLGLALPDVDQGTMYGAPALRVRGQMFACMASHKSAEPNTLVVLVGFDQRDELIAVDPATYYLKDHYVNHPSVLVRLSRIPRDALRDLLLKGWHFTSSQHQLRARRRPRNAGKPKRAFSATTATAKQLRFHRRPRSSTAEWAGLRRSPGRRSSR